MIPAWTTSGGEGRDWYLLNLAGGTATDIVSDAAKNETMTDIHSN